MCKIGLQIILGFPKPKNVSTCQLLSKKKLTRRENTPSWPTGWYGNNVFKKRKKSCETLEKGCGHLRYITLKQDVFFFTDNYGPHWPFKMIIQDVLGNKNMTERMVVCNQRDALMVYLRLVSQSLLSQMWGHRTDD